MLNTDPYPHRNLQLGPHLIAPYEGPIVATVGPDGCTNIEEAVKEVFAELGPAAFEIPQIIAVMKTPYTNDVLIRDTGTYADDFGGGGASWSPGSQVSGGGSALLTQSAIRRGDSGYAPEFAAADGDYAYLLNTFGTAPTNVMAESVWMYIVSADLDAGTDKAVIYRTEDDYPNPLVEFALEYDATDGLVLCGYHQEVTGATTNLTATGMVAVTSAKWYKLSFVHEADTDGSATGDGRFRWWLGTNEIANVEDINAAPDAPYSNVSLGLYSVSGCSVDVIFDDLGVAGLCSTNDAPLIIRSPRGHQVSVISTNFLLDRQGFVRLQALRFNNTSTNALLCMADAEGPALASCIVKCDVLVTNCAGAEVIGNTFDYQSRTNQLLFDSCSGVNLHNTIFLNDTLAAPPRAWTTNTTIDISHNVYYPTDWITAGETERLNTDPMLDPTDYFITDSASDAIASGVAAADYRADLNGRRRHPSTPCRGAVEYHIEKVLAVDAGGRILKRDVAGHVMEYDYTSTGALASFTDADDSSNNATYTYDYMGRRIGMTIGSTAYRFVYLGNDVVAEYIDENGDGSVDRKRVYWILPDIDKRIGFVDFDAGGAKLYYYLTDHQQTVLQVTDDSGAPVNRYDYDAYGNVDWNSDNIETNVPNRYLFQGREWDAHAGHYYYRYRTYIPEHGVFTGPDMDLARGITAYLESLSSYLAMGGNPAMYIDPLGLEIRVPESQVAQLRSLIGWENTLVTPSVFDGSVTLSVPDELRLSAYSQVASSVGDADRLRAGGLVAAAASSAKHLYVGGGNLVTDSAAYSADEVLAWGDTSDSAQLSGSIMLALGANATRSGAIRSLYNELDTRIVDKAWRMLRSGDATLEQAAMYRVAERNRLILALRRVDNPMGREYARMLKPDSRLITYGQLRGRGKSNYQILRTKPNARVTGIGRGLRILGPTLMAVGVTVDVIDIAGTPEEQRQRKFMGTVSGYAGALIGAEALGNAGAALGAYCPHPYGKVAGAGLGILAGAVGGGYVGERSGLYLHDSIFIDE